MITTTILNLFYSVVNLILTPVRLLPEATLPVDFTDAVAQVGQYIQPLNVVAPIATLGAIIALFLTIEGFIFLWKGINWLLRRLPTQS